MLREKYLTFPIAPKFKEVHFKIIDGIDHFGEFLRHSFGQDHDNCFFCDEHIETTEHLFYECKCASAFCEDLHDRLFTKLANFLGLREANVIFGVFI